jgi:ABC-type maltose transport system permease subunit
MRFGAIICMFHIFSMEASIPLAILLQSFISRGAGRRIQREMLSTATVLVLLSTAILFVFFQRWFISDLTSAAVKE